MIAVTRLDGREMTVNSDLIATVEKTPDTVITLTTGERMMIKEPVEEVVARVVAFRRRLSAGPSLVEPAPLEGM